MDFDRTWSEYEAGFGDLHGEFWWGNKKLQSFTEPASEGCELVVDQETPAGISSVHFAEFKVIGPMYAIHIGRPMGSHGM